ncbi:hypothetical protein [Amycolatopsis sp. FU40]
MLRRGCCRSPRRADGSTIWRSSSRPAPRC